MEGFPCWPLARSLLRFLLMFSFQSKCNDNRNSFNYRQQHQQQQLQQELRNATELHALAQFLGGVGIAIGAIVLAVGIGYLVVSYGLLKGKGWAWIITVILTIIAIAVQIVSGVTASMFNASFIDDTNSFATGIIAQIVGIAINGVILYYLYRPNVKAFFGKSQPSTTIQR